MVTVDVLNSALLSLLYSTWWKIDFAHPQASMKCKLLGELERAYNSYTSFHRCSLTEGNFFHDAFYFFNLKIKKKLLFFILMFIFVEPPWLKWRVISAWESHLSLKPAAAGEEGSGTVGQGGRGCFPSHGNALTTGMARAVIASWKQPVLNASYTTMEYLITEESYGFQLTEPSNQYGLLQTLIYLSYNSLNLKYYWFSSRWLRG